MPYLGHHWLAAHGPRSTPPAHISEPMTYPGTGPNLLEDGAGWEVAPDGIHQSKRTVVFFWYPFSMIGMCRIRSTLPCQPRHGQRADRDLPVLYRERRRRVSSPRPWNPIPVKITMKLPIGWEISLNDWRLQAGRRCGTQLRQRRSRWMHFFTAQAFYPSDQWVDPHVSPPLYVAGVSGNLWGDKTKSIVTRDSSRLSLVGLS